MAISKVRPARWVTSNITGDRSVYVYIIFDSVSNIYNENRTPLSLHIFLYAVYVQMKHETFYRNVFRLAVPWEREHDAGRFYIEREKHGKSNSWKCHYSGPRSVMNL